MSQSARCGLGNQLGSTTSNTDNQWEVVSASGSGSGSREAEGKGIMDFGDLVTDDVCSAGLISIVTEVFKFTAMTPVQQATITRFLGNQDVAVEACTGSGKTLAFLLPMFQMLLNSWKKELDEEEEEEEEKHQQLSGIRGVVIAPTRELARQIFTVAMTFVEHLATSEGINVGCVLLTGGNNVEKDVDRLCSKDSNVIVATPGRLSDLLQRFGDEHKIKANLRMLEVLVLDEADVLLEMGFEPALEVILKSFPKQRRTGLFSATQTNETKKLIRAGLRNPALISVKVSESKQKSTKGTEAQHQTIEERVVPEKLTNYYLVCEEDEKLQKLVQFLLCNQTQKVIVFVSTCACVDFFAKILQLFLQYQRRLWKQSFDIVSLHGRMPQKKREQNYKNFSSLTHGLLICTDVAARGVDFPQVDWIIQFHPPQDPSFFVHRVGRTARAGKSGRALLFLLPKEDAYIPFLRNRKVPLELITDALRPVETKGCPNILTFLREQQFKDRYILEKGTQAFISHIRSYKEHRLSFIFRMQDLNMFRVATAFVLFRVPNLSELRVSKGIQGYPEVDSNIVKNIKFKEKRREKQRSEKYERHKESSTSGQLAGKGKEKQQPKKAATSSRKGKKSKAESSQAKKKPKRKGRNKQILEEWNDLAKEERLYKRLKRNKISKAEYDELIASLS